MSVVGKRRTHVEARHGAQRKLLPVVAPIALPASWDMLPGVPATRAECIDAPRPCPYVSCRQHLWLVLQQDRPGNPATGSQGDTTLRAIGPSCALDVADEGAHSLVEVGELLGVTGERAHQIAKSGLDKLKAMGVNVDKLMAVVACDDRDAA